MSASNRPYAGRAGGRVAKRGRLGAAGSSAVEVMLALVILSTAILGAAAAQAGGWRVLAGSRQDTGAWAAMHAQAEELTAAGYDAVASGNRVVSGYPIRWVVSNTDPKVALVIAERRIMGELLADSIRLVFRKPAP